jgi:hypothetical protein
MTYNKYELTMFGDPVRLEDVADHKVYQSGNRIFIEAEPQTAMYYENGNP